MIRLILEHIVFFHGTREQFKNSIKSLENVDDNQLDSEIDLDLDNGIGEIRGGLIFVDYRKLFSKDGIPLHGDIPKEMYPKICCFSGTCRSILMWSHYADRHRGICLRFRSLKNQYIKDEDTYYLEFDYSNLNEALRVARADPFHNLFYEIAFQEVHYSNDVPESVNLFDKDGNIKLHKFLLNKFTDWIYENDIE